MTLLTLNDVDMGEVNHSMAFIQHFVQPVYQILVQHHLLSSEIRGILSTMLLFVTLLHSP